MGHVRFWVSRPVILLLCLCGLVLLITNALFGMLSDWSMAGIRLLDRLVITCNIWSRWGVLTRPKCSRNEE